MSIISETDEYRVLVRQKGKHNIGKKNKHKIKQNL
jgi:hypothetical protein